MLFLALLIYFSGAFVFDPDDSVEPVQSHRLRAAVEVVAMPALNPEPFVRWVPGVDRLPRPARLGQVPVARPAASHLSRAALDSVSRSAEDTH